MTTKVQLLLMSVESHSTSMLLYFVMVIQCAVCILRDCVIFFFYYYPIYWSLIHTEGWSIQPSSLLVRIERRKELWAETPISFLWFCRFCSFYNFANKNLVWFWNHSTKSIEFIAPLLHQKKSFQNEKKVENKNFICSVQAAVFEKNVRLHVRCSYFVLSSNYRPSASHCQTVVFALTFSTHFVLDCLTIQTRNFHFAVSNLSRVSTRFKLVLVFI